MFSTQYSNLPPLQSYFHSYTSVKQMHSKCNYKAYFPIGQTLGQESLSFPNLPI